jgi:hypothetical protein
MIWLHVRLSPVLPLIVLRRRFAIGEAWRMTKGEVWPLLGGYAAIMLIGLVATIAAYAVAVGPYLGALARGASSNMATEAIAGIGPLTVIGWIVNGVVVAIIYAMWAGSVGTATYQLIGAEGGGVNYAETFG